MSCMVHQSLADAPAALPQINTWLSNTRIRIWRPALQALTDPGDLHVAAGQCGTRGSMRDARQAEPGPRTTVGSEICEKDLRWP